MDITLLTQKEFDALPEYSRSNPTGTTVGKKWKRKVKDSWYLCEYIPCDEIGYIDILLKLIAIV
jgi:hypothetical protein